MNVRGEPVTKKSEAQRYEGNQILPIWDWLYTAELGAAIVFWEQDSGWAGSEIGVL